LKQETIYFEVTDAEVEFIRPLFETGNYLFRSNRCRSRVYSTVV